MEEQGNIFGGCLVALAIELAAAAVIIGVIWLVA